MNILKFLETFTNDGVMQTLNNKASRRDSFSQFGKLGATAAMAAVPFGLLSSNKVYAKSSAKAAFFTTVADTPTSALQLALTLEYLEDEFYQTALDRNNFLAGDERVVIQQISKHEAAHVNLLRGALGNNAPAKPTFDFTAGGTFSDVFTNPQTFFALAQAFEDTGVRAYKGQAGALLAEKDLLTTALQIHSVEARHASQIRRMRDLKGWIPGNDEGGHPAAADAVYAGENNTNQAGFNTASVPGNFTPALTATGGTESFDEPLTTAQSTTIASLFIRS